MTGRWQRRPPKTKPGQWVWVWWQCGGSAEVEPWSAEGAKVALRDDPTMGAVLVWSVPLPPAPVPPPLPKPRKAKP